jgi:hypothetical protein
MEEAQARRKEGDDGGSAMFGRVERRGGARFVVVFQESHETVLISSLWVRRWRVECETALTARHLGSVVMKADQSRQHTPLLNTIQEIDGSTQLPTNDFFLNSPSMPTLGLS